MKLIDADELMKRLEEKSNYIEENCTNEVQKYDMVNGFMSAVHVIAEMPTIENKWILKNL